MAKMPSIPAGPDIPGYELLEEIGRGAMGHVYRARQRSLGRIVAIKVLSRRLVRSEKYVHRFLQEARIAAKIDHPNAIHVFDCGAAGRYHYLVMEYVPGRALSEILARRSTLRESRALALAEEVASALAQAHRLGILHRDVKPSNIIVTRATHAKLADLGLAKQMRAADEGLTRTGFAVGTPAYMAPEQCRGEEDEDARSDIYSLGLTLYHMLAGRPPFEANNDLQIMHKQITEPLPPVETWRPSLSEGTCAVVAKMTAKRREERYASMDEVVAELRALRAAGAPRALAEKRERDQAPTPATLRAQRRRRWLWAAVAALLLAAATGAFLAQRLLRDPPPSLVRAGQLEGETRLLEALQMYNRLAETAAADDVEAARVGAARVLSEMKLEPLLFKARERKEAGDLRQAVAYCRYLRQQSGGAVAAHATALEREAAAEGYKRAMADVEVARDRRDWTAMAEAAELAAYFRPGDRAAADTAGYARFNALCAEGRAAAARGDYATAIERYQRALQLRADVEVMRELLHLRQEAARSGQFENLVAALANATSGDWPWTAEQLVLLSTNREAAWDLVHKAAATDEQARRARPLLLLGLHRLGDAAALGEEVKLFEAGGADAVRAGRALAAIGAPAAVRLVERLPAVERDVRRRIFDLLGSMGGDAAPALAQAAASDAAAVRAPALDLLVALGSPAAPTLLTLVDSKAPVVQQAAGDALARLGAAALPAVIVALPKMDKATRGFVLRCVENMGPDAVEPLATAAAGNRDAAEAVQTLVARLGVRAAPVLLGMLSKGGEKDRKTALDLLVHLGVGCVPALLPELRDNGRYAAEARTVLQTLGETAVAPLVAELGDKDAAVRDAAGRALVIVGTPAVPGLVQAVIAGKPPEARTAGIAALKQMGDAGAAGLLLLTMSDNRTVVAAALKAFQELGDAAVRTVELGLADARATVRAQSLRLAVAIEDRKALPRMRALLRDDSEHVREFAATALGLLPDDASVDPLARATGDRSARVRQQVVAALGKIGGRQAAGAVVSVLGDRDAKVRAEAEGVVARLGAEALPALDNAVRVKDDSLALQALAAARKIDAPGVLDVVIDALLNGSDKVRVAAVEALGALGKGRAVPSLVRALQDESTDVRVAAIKALAAIGDRTVVQDIVLALQSSSQVAVRVAAADALPVFGGEPARAALVMAAEHDRANAVRLAASRALRRF